jgi:hypothetical protein
MSLSSFPHSLILRLVYLMILPEVVITINLLCARTRLIFMDIRDICPYTRGTPAYRLLSRKEILSFCTIKEYKTRHSPPGEKTVNLVDLEGFEPSTSSVRWMRKGLSASSAAYCRGFYPRKIRKNGDKTVQKLIFHHAKYFALHTVAHDCTWHEEGNADPTLSCVESIAN